MTTEEFQLLRTLKFTVIMGLVALVSFFSISTVFGQSATVTPTDDERTINATPTLVIPKEAPATGRAK